MSKTGAAESSACGIEATALRTEHEIRREPAVQPDEQRSDVRDDWMKRCREQAEPEQGRDDGRRHRVRDHGIRGHGAELEEEDRRGRDSARDRHGHDRCRRTRQRIALQPTHQAGHEREDGGDSRKRELEARIEQVVRVPREQHESAEEQEPPAIPLAGTHPREGCEPARDTGPNDRRLRADGEHVRADRRERADLARHARDTEQPRDEQHAARDERDVLARDGEQVVEARGTERVPQVFVEPFVFAEHDPEQHGTPLAGDARRERGGDRSPEPVGDAAEASPATDDLWIATAEDHVNAVTPKPRCARRSRPRCYAARPRGPGARGSSPAAATYPPAAGAGPARARRGRRSDRCARVCEARTASGEQAR